MTEKNGNFTHKDGVSLKEFFEARLLATDIALKHQAKEYARRLDELNHEAERLTLMQAKYLPRETADEKDRQVDRRFIEIDKQIVELKEYKASVEGKASQRSVTTTLVLAVFGLVLAAASSMMTLLNFIFMLLRG
jgi:hypothetical protein